MSKLDDLKTIDAAAKEIGMDRARLRSLCIAAGVAIRWGGSDRHPRLKVRMSEVEKVVLAQVYTPSRPSTRFRPQLSPQSLAAMSDVRC
jgi:hypothetical protein